MKRILIAITAAAAVCIPTADACTSMIVAARASATGRPLLWKHRDSSGDMNFVERTLPTDSTYGFCALYNGGDSLLLDAWIGVNDAGFAIMNTASYNLAPDTATVRDMEGRVMAIALKRCSSVEQFDSLLRSLPRPMGVQANFGAIDSDGGAAYFETDDNSFVRYDVDDTPEGVLVRTNFSVSGAEGEGMGYIRYANAQHLAGAAIRAARVSPQLLTDTLSRSFYHSLLDRDCAADTALRWIVDQDFIPRHSSVASVVIEGAVSGAGNGPVMWTIAGYPPVGHVVAARPDSVPDALRPLQPGFTCAEAVENAARMRLAFPIDRGSGQRYIDMQALRPIMDEQRAISLSNYNSKP
ncbi:MAG: C45 family peptidase [Muribaculaceae bacterium]|nr:C45 family peptidase [Muribaculaceae bacterium]